MTASGSASQIVRSSSFSLLSKSKLKLELRTIWGHLLAFQYAAQHIRRRRRQQPLRLRHRLLQAHRPIADRKIHARTPSPSASSTPSPIDPASTMHGTPNSLHNRATPIGVSPPSDWLSNRPSPVMHRYPPRPAAAAVHRLHDDLDPRLELVTAKHRQQPKTQPPGPRPPPDAAPRPPSPSNRPVAPAPYRAIPPALASPPSADQTPAQRHWVHTADWSHRTPPPVPRRPGAGLGVDTPRQRRPAERHPLSGWCSAPRQPRWPT